MTKELPLYTCHKRVRALEIRSIGSYSTDAKGELRREVVFADPAFPRIDVPGNMFERYVPKPGDYYVVYEDGYASFSPRKAFLDGYQLASGLDTLMAQLQGLSEIRHSLDDGIPTVARVAREAYVTINSLKQQIERLQEQTTPRADGTAITDRIIEAIAQNPNEPFITGELQGLLRACYSEIARLRADATITRQMAGFKEVKSEKADPDQPE